MAVEQRTEVSVGTAQNNWISAGIAGLLGGVVFGLLAQALMPEAMGAIGALYTFEGNATVGWIAHLVHSAIFGLVYAAVVSVDRLRGYAGRVTTGAGLGLAYGVVLWVVAATLVMPVWLAAVTEVTPAVPNVEVMSLVGHVVYGVLLGATYPWLLRWWERR